MRGALSLPLMSHQSSVSDIQQNKNLVINYQKRILSFLFYFKSFTVANGYFSVSTLAQVGEKKKEPFPVTDECNSNVDDVDSKEDG